MDELFNIILTAAICLTTGANILKQNHLSADHTVDNLTIQCPSNKTCHIADNKTICWPVSCPQTPCDDPILTPGDCCSHCPPCPYPCQINGHHFCYPIPCPPPACVDSITSPGDCCEHCPNGPNCGKDGQIIPWNHSKIIDGKNCTCVGPQYVKCV